MTLRLRQLRLPRHRATTANLCAAYPFLAEAGLGADGVYLGTNLLTGGSAFAFDPFEAYGAGLLTNPNILLAGEPGTGKSSTAKVFIHRSVGVFGRWVAIADPKGEYLPLAETLGLSVIKLHPGGHHRLNPLDPGPARADDGPDELARRQTTMVAALLASVLHRDLTPVEDAVLGWAITHLARHATGPVTLADVATVMSEPTEDMARLARTSPIELAHSVDAAIYGLGKLLDRSLRGMFDGPTNVTIDWDGPGIVLDLSAVHHDPEALTLVMIAATAWLQAVLARPDGPRRIQVLDEAWALLGSERTSKYLQACWKLSRAYGVANLAIVHRLSDLRAQSDDGSSASKVSMGLLADTQTRILLRQSTDQVSEAKELLGLTTTEAALLPRLAKGRALWKVGARTAVVAHVIAPEELHFCDTDSRMANR
ncbi:MAG: VirB4 family type IV secretion system protein [Acidimicrobiia bacterium]